MSSTTFFAEPVIVVSDTMPHRETMADLDPERVEDAADRVVYLGSTTTPVKVDKEDGAQFVKGLSKSAGSLSTVLPPDEEDGSVVGEFGQDRVWACRVNGEREGKPFSVHIAACADGHGHTGEVVSREVMDGLRSRLTVLWLGEVLGRVMSGGDVREPLETLYTDLDASTQSHVHSGTTLSLLLVFGYDGRVVALASNVGDSPVLLVNNETGKVVKLHGEHNWDSVTERRLNLAASRAAGRRDATVVYARFNCGNGRAFRDPWGGNAIMPMFREGTDEVLEETRRHMMRESKRRGYVGGHQSLRRLKQLRRNPVTDQWQEEALEEYGHENFGSTPLLLSEDGVTAMGGGQMTRCLGDHIYKQAALSPSTPLVTATPSVTLQELSVGDYSYVVCSDGVGDAFYWHQIGDVFYQVYQSNPAVTNAEVAKMLFYGTQVRGSAGFRFEAGSRAWDDLSMVVGRVRVRLASVEEEPAK